MYTALTLIATAIALLVLYETARIGAYGYRAKMSGKKTVPVKRIDPQAAQQVLIIGDSTAFGTGAQDQKNSLVGRLAADFPRAAITNESENAMTIERLKEKLEALQGKQFDIIMMHIGGMDTVTFTSKHKIQETFKRAVELACQMSRDKIIVVSMNNVGSAPLFRFPLSSIYERRSRALRDLFSELCTTAQVVHVSLYEERTDDPCLKDPDKFFAYDGIHPSDEGYGYWYQKIKRAVSPYLAVSAKS